MLARHIFFIPPNNTSSIKFLVRYTYIRRDMYRRIDGSAAQRKQFAIDSTGIVKG